MYIGCPVLRGAAYATVPGQFFQRKTAETVSGIWKPKMINAF